MAVRPQYILLTRGARRLQGSGRAQRAESGEQRVARAESRIRLCLAARAPSLIAPFSVLEY
jgi:hypothetical protein